VNLPMNLHGIETPALVLDLNRLEANAARMQARMNALGVALRPHLKTAKSAGVAELAIARGARGIAVATLQEAEYFLSRGITDLQYPVCIVPGKFGRVARLLRLGAQLSVILDSLAVAQALADFARREQLLFRVFLEIDCGEHRTGFALPDEDFLAAATVLQACEYVDLRGVLTHGGQSYHCTQAGQISAVAEQEREAAVQAAGLLRAAGIACPEVSVGSTPTACFGESFAGVTEVRAGVYLFGDLFQAALGTCDRDSLAVSVLATVISHNRAKNTLVVDAGGLALSKDRSRVSGGPDTGYGLCAALDGNLLTPDAAVFDVHQEHGEIRCQASPGLANLQVGSRLRIYPNHACMTAAMYDRYHLVRGPGTDVLQVWDKTQGW
jgi:D-serine deaminase-like pyridoxal phosphate-dependent protein